MSEYGCWNHESTGFIFSRSLKSPNIFYILTEGDAVVKWNEYYKQFEKSKCISFHLLKNIDTDIQNGLVSNEVARFTAVSCTVHPKYLNDKLSEYNIAIITIKDSANKLEKIKPLKLTQSTKHYKNYNEAKVFGFGGIWDHELFGMKGNINCSNGKIINFKNIIARGSGG
eukprot:200715_1